MGDSGQQVTSEERLNNFDQLLAERDLDAKFQVIVQESRGVIGAESFIRGPSDSPFHSPLFLYDFAQKVDRLRELEKASLDKALQTYANELRDNFKRFFVNVEPQLISDPEFPGDFVEGLEYDRPDVLVFEIPAEVALNDQAAVEQWVKAQQNRGVQVAFKIKNASTAQDSLALQTLEDLRPDYLKLGRRLTEDLGTSEAKQQQVRSVYEYAYRSGMKLVIEGVEEVSEARMAREIGLKIMQGNYFAPVQHPPLKIEHDLDDV